MIAQVAALFAFVLTGKGPGSSGTNVVDKANLWGLSDYLGASETPPPSSADAFPSGSTPTGQTTAAPELTALYLERPELLQSARAIRDAAVKNWKDGKAPYTLDSFLAAVKLQAGGDTGTALVLCINVARAFARGGYRIYWQRVRDWQKHFPRLTPPATFRDEDYTTNNEPNRVDPRLFYRFPQAQNHPDGLILETERIDRSPGAPDGAVIKVKTIYWALFDARDLDHVGDPHRDPGDHYHFYSIAAAAFFGAQKRVTFDDIIGTGLRVKLLLRTALRVLCQLEGLGAREPATVMATDPARFGWLWANALSFIEEANYGEPDKQAEATREANMHRKGAAFGLSQAGASVSPAWRWYVAKAGSLVSEAGARIQMAVTTGSDPSMEEVQEMIATILSPQTGDEIPRVTTPSP